MLTGLDFGIIYQWIPQILLGCAMTVYLSILGFVFGTILGVAVGALRSYSKASSINSGLAFYVEVFRGSPLLVQLFFIYFGLPELGIVLSPMQAAVIGLSLNSGAYISEIIRSCISAIDYGQYEAALSLGMTNVQAMMFVILPQALRISIPPMVNSFSAILKDSSLVSILAIAELTRIGQLIYTKTFRPFEVYSTVGTLYLVMTLIVSRMSRSAEKASISTIKTR